MPTFARQDGSSTLYLEVTTKFRHVTYIFKTITKTIISTGIVDTIVNYNTRREELTIQRNDLKVIIVAIISFPLVGGRVI